MRIISLLVGLFLAACPLSAASADVLINIDKNAQTMTVSVDGSVFAQWPVSTGRAGYATPSGTFTPFRMEEDHFSREWDDAPMPHSIFFTPKGHAIHGTLDSRKLGVAASHGCVRLNKNNAALLYWLVSSQGLNKTKVVISGEDPLGAAPPVARQTPQRDYDTLASDNYDDRYGITYDAAPVRRRAPQYRAPVYFSVQPRPYYEQRYYYQPYGYYR